MSVFLSRTIALIALISLISTTQNVHASIVTNNASLFPNLIDSFEGDANGALPASPGMFTTALGNEIEYTVTGGSTQNIGTGLYAAPAADGSKVWQFRAINGTALDHSATFTFGSAVTSFGLYVGDFGDGGASNSLTITASDGTVLFDWDEAVDGAYGPTNANFFVGVYDGNFTHFTVESHSASNDNFWIDGIRSVPEPGSAALIFGILAAIGLRRRSR